MSSKLAGAPSPTPPPPIFGGSKLAARCTVPVTVKVELPERPAMAVEGIVYFTTAELLTNISKHSDATRATVEVWRAAGELFIRVGDDGQGGAAPSGGSGLAGLAERLGAVDGGLTVDSPPGGPTTVTARLPWREHAPAAAAPAAAAPVGASATGPWHGRKDHW